MAEPAPILLGVAAGVLASSVMYALLFPVARGSELPPESFARTILRRPLGRPALRVAGIVVQVAFGAFYGAVFGLAGAKGFVPGDSFPVLGIVVGLAAFLVSFTGFRVLRLVPGPVDWRAWAGHFLNHVVFGVTLGLVFLWFT